MSNIDKKDLLPEVCSYAVVICKPWDDELYLLNFNKLCERTKRLREKNIYITPISCISTLEDQAQKVLHFNALLISTEDVETIRIRIHEEFDIPYVKNSDNVNVIPLDNKNYFRLPEEFDNCFISRDIKPLIELYEEDYGKELERKIKSNRIHYYSLHLKDVFLKLFPTEILHHLLEKMYPVVMYSDIILINEYKYFIASKLDITKLVSVLNAMDASSNKVFPTFRESKDLSNVSGITIEPISITDLITYSHQIKQLNEKLMSSKGEINNKFKKILKDTLNIDVDNYLISNKEVANEEINSFNNNELYYFVSFYLRNRVKAYLKFVKQLSDMGITGVNLSNISTENHTRPILYNFLLKTNTGAIDKIIRNIQASPYINPQKTKLCHSLTDILSLMEDVSKDKPLSYLI